VFALSRTDWDDDDDDDDQRPKQGQEEPSEAFGAFTTMAAMGGGGDACTLASACPPAFRALALLANRLRPHFGGMVGTHIGQLTSVRAESSTTPAFW